MLVKCNALYYTSAFVVCNYTVFNENQVSIVSYTNQDTTYTRSMSQSKVILETRICNVYLTAYLIPPPLRTNENITCEIKYGYTHIVL